jgi:pilus assembly protein FimV
MPETFGSLAAGPAPETPTSETPLRIVLLGDFTGRSEKRLVKIDRENFDTVMLKLGARVGLPVGDDDEEVAVRFGSLNDFHPDELVDKIERFEDCDEDEKGDLMRTVLHHPAFQEMESAWRGLDFLQRRTLKGRTVETTLFDISLAELTADLTATDDLAATATYGALVEKSSRGPKAVRWGLFIGLYLFEHSAAHAGLLGRMARIARAAGATFLAGAHPNLVTRGATPAAASTWNAMRALPEAAMVGLVAPRFLLRQPYGSDTKSIDKFEFEEFHRVKSPRPYLWGSSGLVVAALLAEAFQKEGWSFKPGKISDLGGMPLHAYTEDDEECVALAETWLSRQQAEAVVKLGVMPLLAVRGRDAVSVGRFLSLAAPPKDQPAVDLAGPWGLSDVGPMASSAAPIGVKVGMGLPGGTGAAATAKPPAPPKPAKAAAEPTPAPAAEEKEDEEMAALLAKPEPAAAPPAEEEDAELAALLGELGGGAEEAPAPAAAEEEDPELADLMKQLGGEQS